MGNGAEFSRLRRYVLGVTSRRVRYDAFHEVFEPLEREAMLWRYVDFTKLIALLETGSLHFARTDQLNDPFEGSMTGPMAAPITAFFPPESLGEMAPDAVARADSGVRVARQQARMQTYLCCWNHSEIESDALWGRYVQAEAGIAIRSTFGRLVDCFGTDPLPPPPIDERGPHSFPARECVFVGKVNYVDYETAVWPVNNGFWPFVHKRLSFSYENEVRATIWDVPPVLDSGSETPLGLNVDIDVERLIESLWISPVAPSWLLELVEAVCSRYGMQFAVQMSALSGSPLY